MNLNFSLVHIKYVSLNNLTKINENIIISIERYIYHTESKYTVMYSFNIAKKTNKTISKLNYLDDRLSFTACTTLYNISITE